MGLAGRPPSGRAALALLGVVLFATNRQATAIHRSVRDRVAVAFGVGSHPC
ncbi:hypothetical protein [Nonomuraea sp. NPDC052265]|uniref:hypothetical protein n=1 Tax=Nonomuraea sp. NPDC052265 TaxID=3364374 RepID=UPI0037C6F9CE